VGALEDAGAPPRLAVAEKVRGQTGRGSGRLVFGDALATARALLGEGLEQCADLVYIDPPFASQANYVHEARLDGSADGRVVRSLAYTDRWRDRTALPGAEDGVGGYLEMLAPRLEAAARLLAPTGTLWVHLDWRASYLVRVVLDEILGRERFINEIVWRRAPNLGRQAASAQFGRTLDSILVYGADKPKLTLPTRLEPIEPSAIRFDEQERPFTSAPRGDYTDASIAKLDAEGRVHRTRTGKVYIKYFLVKDEAGQWCRERRVDTLWTDIPPLRHATPGERTGFPTQKPCALLERIVKCAAPEGGLVVDLFSGSGTAGVAASTCGRRFILGDAGPVAIATARSRLLRAGAGLLVESADLGDGRGMTWPEGPPVVTRARPKESGTIEVGLVAPAEPSAWALGLSKGSGSPLEVIWHSERCPGKKTVPAELVAEVKTPEGPLFARVYGDDGAVSTAEVKLP
jgi:DNA modification methylase